MRTVVHALKKFGGFWYDFLIGDDWTIAASVLLALGATAGLDHAGVAAWWLLPPLVLAVLAWSLRRANARDPAREAKTDPAAAGVDFGQ